MANCTLPMSQTAFRAQPHVRVGVQHVVPDIVLHPSQRLRRIMLQMLLKTSLMYGGMWTKDLSFNLTYAADRSDPCAICKNDSQA